MDNIPFTREELTKLQAYAVPVPAETNFERLAAVALLGLRFLIVRALADPSVR